MGLLEGKVAVITGAASGVGSAIARLFAQEGARLVVNDLGTDDEGHGREGESARRSAQSIIEAGGVAVDNDDDVSTREGAESLVRTAMDHFGRVDVLINNAGFLRNHGILNLSERDWEDVIAVHLHGTFHCTRAAAVLMRAQNSGRIVNTTNLAAMTGGFGQCNYAAAASAVYGLTRAAATELGRYGIFVNAVAPLAKTRLTEALPLFRDVQSMSPEHAAPLYLFLASELSHTLTGQVFAIAGGMLTMLRVMESPGCFKSESEGNWTAEEISRELQTITRA